MNLKQVFYILGRISRVMATLLLLPAVAALCYGESKPLLCFVAVAAGAYAVGWLVSRFCQTKNEVIYAKEGFAIVALAWLYVSAVGALPFVLAGEIPSYVDAFFETVSGFTTTGASVLPDVTALSHGMLFWRSFTHFIGGMGVLVFVMALFPKVADRSIHILRAEVPGPVCGKLVPRIRDTAKILYLIYIALTLLEAVLLLAGGMPLFDSLLHAFGTAGTGGFGIRGDSLASYSPYCQWVIAIFMLIFGVNFNLYYLILIRRASTALKSRELWFYGSIVAVCTALITFNTLPLGGSWSDTVRHAVFQVASIVTTTGYSTVDFNLWPGLSKAVLLILMLPGACAGSTAGGLKLSRVMLLGKNARRTIRKLTHPRSVSAVRFEGKTVDEATLDSVSAYFILYCLCMVVLFLLISWEPFSIETNLSATFACFNNIGPGLGAVGPMASYFDYHTVSKILLSFAMLLGRLEIFPLLIVFTPSTWARK